MSLLLVTAAATGAIAGTAALVFSQTGVLRGSGNLAGTIGLVFGQTGNLKGAGRLVGTTPLVFGQTGPHRSSICIPNIQSLR